MWGMVRTVRRVGAAHADLLAAMYLAGVVIDKAMNQGGDVYVMRYEPKSGRPAKPAVKFIEWVWGTSSVRGEWLGVHVRGRVEAWTHARTRWQGLSPKTRMTFLADRMGGR